MYDLVYRIKEINSDLPAEQKASVPISSLEIKEVIDHGFSIVCKKIEESYLKKGKLDKQEFINITDALKLIGNDLMNGGINPGLYYYLFETMPQLTKEDYQDKYHNIFEYIVKIYRQELAELLK